MARTTHFLSSSFSTAIITAGATAPARRLIAKILLAFDFLAMDANDLRDLPLSMRKTNLQRLLARRPEGIFLSDYEQGEIGPKLFRKACEFGFEGLVSKPSDRPYRGGRCTH
ncbi:hypothetical protein [Bradyrhizobium sp. 6(2017)]|uniref:ATP-dependent DNA ligase n=1 Tax=Bradyrhizobium sp. 6(2017) TaxID=1197460 RepID=UPI0013E175EB|nr:hypothetical protein [Bradyrhizobium sp. 6(2017)]QIG92797.1 hypothetical protein G6P99_09955 [Bradyrhizobium sp. 6(2017)]